MLRKVLLIALAMLALCHINPAEARNSGHVRYTNDDTVTAQDLNRQELERLTGHAAAAQPTPVPYRPAPARASYRAAAPAAQPVAAYAPAAPVSRPAPSTEPLPAWKQPGYAATVSPQGHEMMDLLNKPVMDQATAKEIVATMQPRLQHYYDEAQKDLAKARAPAPESRVAQTPAAAANPYTLPPQRITNDGGRQYDRLALLNLTRPLNTISADGPSAADERQISAIAAMCNRDRIPLAQCDEMQSNYLQHAVPLIAAAYENQRHPQEYYRVEPDGRIVKNEYIRYAQPEVALTQIERNWIFESLRQGVVPPGASRDPRIMQAWREYCQSNVCKAANPGTYAQSPNEFMQISMR